MRIKTEDIDRMSIVPENVGDKLFLYYFLKGLKKSVQKYIEIEFTSIGWLRESEGGGDCTISELVFDRTEIGEEDFDHIWFNEIDEVIIHTDIW